MSSLGAKAKNALNIIDKIQSIPDLIRKVQGKTAEPENVSFIKSEHQVSQEGIDQRLAFIQKNLDHELPKLTGRASSFQPETWIGNIENFIGLTQVPTGVIGPLRVVGSAAQGDFFVPLSTTEGALVASYHRGAKACTLAGGVTSICLVEGVQRSPAFKFENLGDLGGFLVWLYEQMDHFKLLIRETSNYAELVDLKSNIEGNHLILTFEYSTGDAAGQNMVTICTDRICQYIIEAAPVKPTRWYVEGNYSGDKKATSLSFSSVRGKRVTAEIELSEKLVQDIFKTTPYLMGEYWKTSTMSTIQSGAIGTQGHYANGLTALFLATGQDVACISEAAVGVTRMETTQSGNLYASVTLPNLIVGTVGGGTGLPTQRECLELMDCFGEGKSRKFAEICGAVVLAGELSIAAALSAGHFTAAHQNLGRKHDRPKA